jgi:hypothetical protein
MRKFYAFLLVLLIGAFGFGQTTVTYDFATNGAGTSGSLDGNISFTTAKNSSTSAPGIYSGQLRLYHNTIKGGSIIITPSNGATITSVVINASGTTGDAGYTVDSGSATNLTASTTYTMNSISASSEVEFYQRENGGSNRIYVDSFEITYTPSGAPSTNNIVIGTGTSSTGSSTADPIHGYYQAFKYQVIYTAAELSASLTLNDEITALGWSISGDYNGGDLLGYTIKMGHTSANNSASHDASSTIVVKNAFDYDPTVTVAGVFDMIPFDTNFVWNGIDNVLVEVCSDGPMPYTSPYGRVRGTTVTSGSRSYRVDGGTACGFDTVTTGGHKPNIQFNYTDGIAPTCPDISGLTIDSFTSETAEISWTTGGGESNWDVLIQTDGTGSPELGTPEPTTTDNPYSATGLTQSTAYEVYVRANCGGGDLSDWVGPEIFTTPALCPEVSNITIDSFTGDSVTVSWATGDSEDDWEVAVLLDGTGPPAAAGTATTNNPHTESGLTGTTVYDVYVRADCTDASNGPSNWVGPVGFTTTCSAIVPDYTADMSTNVPDACWDEAADGEVAAGPSGLGTSDWRENRAYAFGPSNAINIYQTNTDREWLLSPTFDLSTGGPYQLEVNVAVTDYTSSGTTTTDGTMDSDDEVQLLISTDGGATWSNLTTWNVANEPDVSGTEYTEDLTAYLGNVQFAIWASDGPTGGSQDYDFHVGKFNVNAIPSAQTVDFCNLQSPGDATIIEGSNFDVYARTYVAGFTEAAGSNPDIEAWIGVNTTDATTTADFTSPSWTWIPATFNAQFGNDDEYLAEIGSALTTGTHYYASRFRADGGPFAYGGITPSSTGGNFWDGTSFVSGQLTVQPAPPNTVATFNINGCGDSDTYSGAYDAGVAGIVWVELIYDGGCSEITVDNETTTGFTDSEIGLYDSLGNLVGNDDDGGTGNLGSLTELALPAGTYYIASGAFNITFGATAFNTTTSSTTATGTIGINASTPNSPDYCNLQFPGTATISAGSTATVYAQIFEAGNTDSPGAGTNITAEIGISAVNATTTANFTSGDWTWTTAPYFGESGSNDEYSLDIGASLAPGTYYYVSRFSVDGGPFAYGGFSGGFWDGISNVSGILTVNPDSEPTNHVITFSAVADSETEITLTWNDNDGAQAADGFLIVGKTGTASFYSPIDGTDPSDDTDWSDDEFEVKVASGVQTHTVTGLTASTLYDFEIYPYTNSGSLIDFKTDGTIPSASATTDADPCSIAITSFPFEEGFEAVAFPPQCWSSFIGTNGEGTGEVWEGSTTANTGSGSAYIQYENVTNSAQDWLVTPALDLSGLTTPELSFFAREDYPSEYGSVQTIRVSTTNTDIASFTTVQSYTEANFDLTFAQFTVDLSAYNSNTTIYIAFVFENDDGDNWFIDDVKVDEAPPVNYTFNGTWSPSDPNGTSTANDDIVVSSGNALISANTTINNMTVNPDAAITVNSGVTLTVNGEITLESVSNMYSSLMQEGTLAGTVRYERYVNANSGGNDLISPPLSGETWTNFLISGTNAADLLDDGNTSPTTYAFGPFDKATGNWVNYTDAISATLNSGTGYRAGTASGTTLTFTGTVVTSSVAVNIEDTGSNYSDWNLIGNPYPAYINMADFLNYDLGGGTKNIDILEGISGIYGYDGSASNGWDVITLANAASRDMAPGQGFFVAANNAFVVSHDITFDTSMRRAGSGDDFIAGRSTAELTFFKLNASTSAKDYTTQFYFNDNATQGLDHGYDAKLWGDNAPSFAVYSNLVQDNSGLPIALQALNPSDLVDVVIPLGVNANLGEQLTFTISETTLPNIIDVYLDDTLNNTSTLLNTADYVITPILDITGTGRFYLRLANQTLSTTDTDFDAIKIYTTPSPRAIFVQGVLNGDTTAKIYDLLGRLVYNAVLDGNSLSNQIDATAFDDGVYVVTLSNGVQEKSQKVILR